eukprot:Sspe_Gene.56258::Locus_30957_Transcript_1_1_Confidence_1.000_Length_848::g.56258::m.56258
MSSLEPRSVLDPSHAPITSPVDGYEYKGLAPEVKAGLEELWEGKCNAARKKQLREWEEKVRLSIKLGQVTVLLPPKSKEQRERELQSARPVAQRGASGWATQNRPAGSRGVEDVKQQFNPYADKQDAPKKPELTKEEKKKKEEEKKKEKEERKKKEEAGEIPTHDFSKTTYRDTKKALAAVQKKVSQLSQKKNELKKQGKEPGADVTDKIEELKQEQAYLQDLVSRGVTTQE